MADKSWELCLTVCLASLLAVHADIKVFTQVGQLFVHELHRETFQGDFEPFLKHYGRVYDDPMVFKCNKQYFPDLPHWLRYTQRHPMDNGFLYGTPFEEDQGKNVIEITVINKRSYDTFRDRMVITVGPSGKKMPYQAEFFIPLREIEKVLPSTVQDDIKQDIQKMWGTHRLILVNISSALERGGRVPLPLPGHYEGVYVKLGSEQPFSDCLLRIERAEHWQQCRATGKASTDCTVCSNPSNCITWCNTTLIDLSKPPPPPPAPTRGSGILEAQGFYDPPESPPTHDYFPAYIGMVIVPLVLIALLCAVLAYIMCCRREGVDKRDAKTADIQLYHHHTIHSDTDELRSMADIRQASRPQSTLPMFNARTGERMPPLQRQFDADSPHIPLIMAQQDPNTDMPSR
ncbi:alpha-sarcoglycan isoform X1 [Brienomyrus brachyistius]|uniref:alpha-sarcoglycan isoform X1 n=1 Tax=Brienomyrus brachyistius TaxID=42636 RepID=UPI0020B24F99|nr:alpha-sarcoglycan isoform X1 [Brienomyrus brachyistius]